MEYFEHYNEDMFEAEYYNIGNCFVAEGGNFDFVTADNLEFDHYKMIAGSQCFEGCYLSIVVADDYDYTSDNSSVVDVVDVAVVASYYYKPDNFAADGQ